MPAPALSITQPKLILGEGIDEVRFFKALLAHLGIVDIQVTDYGGKTKLSDFLQTLPAVPGFTQLRSLMVTRDADASYAAAYQSVCDGLKNAGFPDPSISPVPIGFPAIHIYIMPDNQNAGMLEDLCLASVHSDPAISCVEAYFQCVQQAAGRNPTPLAKARLHAWLASQTDPDRRLGEAAEKGYWPWMVQAFQPLIRLIQSL